MNETFLIADTHFDHINVLKYNNRPWNNIDDMNQGLIENWNKVVGKKDKVIIVGDFAFKRHGYFLNALKGKKDLIIGSHDKMKQTIYKQFSNVYDIGYYKLHDRYFVCCHTCLRVWDKSHYGSILCYGHSHSRLKTFNLSFDVGVDVKINNYSPVNSLEIIKRAEEREIEMMEAGRIKIVDDKKMYYQDDVSYLINDKGIL